MQTANDHVGVARHFADTRSPNAAIQVEAKFGTA